MGVSVTTPRCLVVGVLLLLAHVNARPNARMLDELRPWASQAPKNATELAARTGDGANEVFGMPDSEYPFADTATFRRFFELLNSTLSDVTHSPMYLMQVRLINLDAKQGWVTVTAEP